MSSRGQSWKDLTTSAKAFVGLVVVVGTGVLIYAAVNPTSKNIAKFICYLLVAVLASRLKVVLPGITGTMSVNFLFILLGVLELSFAETLVLGTAAILVQCFYQDRPSALQITFNICASAFSIATVYAVLLSRANQERDNQQLDAVGDCGRCVFPGQYRIDCYGHFARGAKVSGASVGGMLFLVVPLLPGGSRHRRLPGMV